MGAIPPSKNSHISLLYMANIPNSAQSSNIAIDSFKLRIPIEFIEVLDESLLGTWQYVNDKTGEINPYFNKKNSVTIKDKGKTTRYAIEQQVGKNKQVNTYLTMLINSKLLESNYLKGITSETISEIYKAIIAHKVVTLSLSDFIGFGNATDIDFKKDAKIKLFDTAINEMRTISKPSKQKDKGYKQYNKKDNKGIEWSVRQSTSFKSHPFLKVYHKETELRNNSKEFKDNYLQGQDITDIVRIETTIKNNAHLRYLGLPENTLNNMLNLTTEHKETILQSALSKHLEPRINDIKETKEIKPMEQIIYGYINLTLNQGMSYERGKNLVLKSIENKTERSRKRKMLDELYQKYIKGSKNDLKSKENDKFWTFINW